ncbi:hypothetical protein GZ78_08985 [Endozoicomonas numazuensis]|uniref:Uncharacterized protein n=1 Tax=Endozoicomonas numazuensis TaxID=1137799 RepID=A0A081NH69_9GAMM|nr:hypothetical protein GZ78_08985 [Endozoicomonas numazuensis]
MLMFASSVLQCAIVDNPLGVGIVAALKRSGSQKKVPFDNGTDGQNQYYYPISLRAFLFSR